MELRGAALTYDAEAKENQAAEDICRSKKKAHRARLYAVYAHSIEAELRGVAVMHDAQANENMQVTTFADERL